MCVYRCVYADVCVYRCVYQMCVCSRVCVFHPVSFLSQMESPQCSLSELRHCEDCVFSCLVASTVKEAGNELLTPNTLKFPNVHAPVWSSVSLKGENSFGLKTGS